MKLKYSKLVILLAVFSIAISGCSKCQGDDSDELASTIDSMKGQTVAPVMESPLGEIVANISSPVETASLIKRLKVPFDKDLLIPTDVTNRLNTNFQKALGLGLYGTDLGYLNMYEKTSEVLSYISSVKELADGIQVGQFFNFSSLKRLATSNQNLDSLIFISQESYNKIDDYLRNTNRSSLSIVIVAGVWIEGMHLASCVAKKTQSKEMMETVADQKIVLKELIPMLRKYENDPNIKGLADQFDKLNELYNQVKITYEQGETVEKEVNGQKTFEQKDKQIVEASPELMENIMGSIIALRNELISSQE